MVTRARAWLTWTPPVAVALFLLIALRVTAGDSTSDAALDPSTDATPLSTSSPVAGSSGADAPTPSGGSTPPTTGFASREPVLPDEPFDYSNYAADLPAHLAAAVAVDSSPVGNEVTDAGATLGRVLFYDVSLSRNRTVRCASCHVQAHSFTDPLVLSQGVDGFRTRRNSMSLANAAFNPSGRYLWDERAETLEAQVLMPFEDRLEMDLRLPAVIDRISERAFYRPLFVDAFGDDAVTEERLAAALAQFVRSMVSANAPYDEGRAQVAQPGDDFPNFTDTENEGKRLFLTTRAAGGGGCASCHSTEAQISGVDGLKNNGIDPPLAVAVAADLGAFEPSGLRALAGSFRVPSLRNVEVTGPYMHDGRLVSLEDVVEHYSRGVQPHEFLSPELRDDDGLPFRTPFTPRQSQALVAFLRTLTDDEFLSDPRYAEPFRAP